MQCDDSEAIYENGVLVCEGFVLSPATVLSAIGVSSEVAEADLDWFEEQGRTFPTDLSDVCWRQ